MVVQFHNSLFDENSSTIAELSVYYSDESDIYGKYWNVISNTVILLNEQENFGLLFRPSITYLDTFKLMQLCT